MGPKTQQYRDGYDAGFKDAIECSAYALSDGDESDYDEGYLDGYTDGQYEVEHAND